MIKIAKIRDVKTPTRGTELSAGIDFYVPNDFKVNNINNEYFMAPGHNVNIPSGIVAKIPSGHALIAFNKSGVAVKKGLQVGACVIDEDYQGEIHINLINVSNHMTSIKPGEKIVQFLLMPVKYDLVVECDPHLLFDKATSRGSGAFGSTGNK